MTKDEKHNGDGDSINTKQSAFKKWIANYWLTILIGAGATAVLTIGAYGLIAANPDRANVVVVGILSVVSLIVVIVNAVSTAKMVRVMENQESEMTQNRVIVKDQHKAMLDALERTDKLFDQNERSMQNAQSAYIVVRHVHASSYRLGKPFVIAMDVVNTGNTPAYNVQVFAHLDYQTVPFKFTQAQAKKNPLKAAHPATIGPNGDVIGTQFVMTQEVTGDDLKKEKDSVRVHFWGIITYEDVFGRDRWTEFSHRKIYRGQVEIMDSPVRMEVEIGMNSDNNKADYPKYKKKVN
jgi:hypothetical protein